MEKLLMHGILPDSTEKWDTQGYTTPPSGLEAFLPAMSHNTPPERTKYPFRLFSRSNILPEDDAQTNDIPIVDIKSPSPVHHQPSFVVSKRPEQYYFSGITSTETRRQFEEVAVTGADILSRANKPWPGCALPWRVVSLNLKQVKPQVTSAGSVYPSSSSHRLRPGKKRRIMLRKKVSMANWQQDKQAVTAIEKAVLAKEKKARKYRAQKLRRRAQKQLE